jgi:chromosome partitioning protein
MIIAVINQKGGVGKTTTVVNLGVALAEAKYRVLLIDLDPQGSLSSFDSLAEGVEVAATEAGDLQVDLEEHAKAYDFVLIDCPPTLGIECAAALSLCHLAIAPTPPKFLDAHGLAQLTQTVEAARLRGNPSLQLKVLLTMRDGRISVHRELEEGVRRVLGDRVFTCVIPQAAVFDKSALAHRSALQLESRSSGGQAYRELARELLAGFGHQESP